MRRRQDSKAKAFMAVCLALLPAMASCEFLQNPVRPSISVSKMDLQAASSFDLIADFDVDADVHPYKDKISFTWEKLVGARQVEIDLPPGRMIRDEFGPDEGAMIEVHGGYVRVDPPHERGRRGESQSRICR